MTAPLDQLKLVAQKAVAIHGRVDIVVNNAGEPHACPYDIRRSRRNRIRQARGLQWVLLKKLRQYLLAPLRLLVGTEWTASFLRTVRRQPWINSSAFYLAWIASVPRSRGTAHVQCWPFRWDERRTRLPAVSAQAALGHDRLERLALRLGVSIPSISFVITG